MHCNYGLCCQKQVSQAGINNCIPQNTVGCNWLCCRKQVYQAGISNWLCCQKQLFQPGISNWPCCQKQVYQSGISKWLCCQKQVSQAGISNWLCCQKQVSQAGISNCIPQNTVGCNYLSLPEIPASGNKVHHSGSMTKQTSPYWVTEIQITPIITNAAPHPGSITNIYC